MKLAYSLSILFIAGVLRAEPSGVDTTPHAHQRVLEASNEKEGLGVLRLDSEVFRDANQNLGDLRLLSEADSAFEEIPYIIERKVISKPAKHPRPIPSRVLDFSETENGTIEVIVELEEDSGKAAVLKIETPLRDFEKQIQVSGSSDQSNWTGLVTEGLIFDHERFLDFRRTTLELPANDFRWFRVRISGATDQQRSLVRSLHKTVSESNGLTMQESLTETKRTFRIDRLAFYTEKQSFEKRMSMLSYPAEIFANTVNEETNQSEILLDIESCPVDTLRFETPDRNFRRNIEIQAPRAFTPSGEVSQWRTFHKTSIHRFQIGDFSEEKMEVSFSPPAINQRARQLRILLSNGDSPPITIERIKAFGEIYDLKFLTTTSGTRTLYFGAGGNDIQKPSYDVSAIRIADRENVEQILFTAGPVIANPAFTGSASRGLALNQPWILWLAIIAVVACLVLVLVRAATKIQEIPEAEEE
ncbi:MAG: hypothetical protein P1U87_15165 [Verrucomicrobiales bacterium]|nr:hypothetical protein [Verrucomicrobiales bacterium]